MMTSRQPDLGNLAHVCVDLECFWTRYRHKWFDVNSYTKYFYLFIFICMSLLSVCMFMYHVWLCCPWHSSSGAGIADCCELSCGCQGSNPGPLEGQPLLLTPQPSLQPQVNITLKQIKPFWKVGGVTEKKSPSRKLSRSSPESSQIKEVKAFFWVKPPGSGVLGSADVRALPWCFPAQCLCLVLARSRTF